MELRDQEVVRVSNWLYRVAGFPGRRLRGRTGAVDGVRAAGPSPGAPRAGGGRDHFDRRLAGVGGFAAGATSVALTACGSVSPAHVAGGDAARGASMSTGKLTTAAGTGAPGPFGDGGPAAQAYLNGACGVTTDGSGNLVIADTENGLVRVVAARPERSTAGRPRRTSTAAWRRPSPRRRWPGHGGQPHPSRGEHRRGGQPGDRRPLQRTDPRWWPGPAPARSTARRMSRPGTSTRWPAAGPTASQRRRPGHRGSTEPPSGPRGEAVDAMGNLVIADTSASRIRVVAASTGTFYGVSMTAGDIYTVARYDRPPRIRRRRRPGHRGGGAVHPGRRGDGRLGQPGDRGRGQQPGPGGGGHYQRALRQPMTAGDIYTVAA